MQHGKWDQDDEAEFVEAQKASELWTGLVGEIVTRLDVGRAAPQTVETVEEFLDLCTEYAGGSPVVWTSPRSIPLPAVECFDEHEAEFCVHVIDHSGDTIIAWFKRS